VFAPNPKPEAFDCRRIGLRGAASQRQKASSEGTTPGTGFGVVCANRSAGARGRDTAPPAFKGAGDLGDRPVTFWPLVSQYCEKLTIVSRKWTITGLVADKMIDAHGSAPVHLPSTYGKTMSACTWRGGCVLKLDRFALPTEPLGDNTLPPAGRYRTDTGPGTRLSAMCREVRRKIR
jgi:hypothetical protein